MILVFNKTDVHSHEFAHEWMTDFEAFQAALRKGEDDELHSAGGGGSGYMGNLLNSMSLMLEEFYKHLSLVGVSAMAGTGIDEFLDAVKGKVDEYEKEYKPELEVLKKRREQETAAKQQRELDRLLKDMQVDPAEQTPGTPRGAAALTTGGVQADVLSDFESDSEGGGLVERDEDEELEKNGGDNDGHSLQARYQQALTQDKDRKDTACELDTESFVRYLMANKG